MFQYRLRRLPKFQHHVVLHGTYRNPLLVFDILVCLCHLTRSLVRDLLHLLVSTVPFRPWGWPEVNVIDITTRTVGHRGHKGGIQLLRANLLFNVTGKVPIVVGGDVPPRHTPHIMKRVICQQRNGPALF